MDVNDSELGPLLTVREVAGLLHVHSNTARRWSDQGLIRAYRISRRGDRRFRREDITHFVAELTANAGDKRKVNSTQI
jgi:excisionase family DNA binding protein